MRKLIGAGFPAGSTETRQWTVDPKDGHPSIGLKVRVSRDTRASITLTFCQGGSPGGPRLGQCRVSNYRAAKVLAVDKKQKVGIL